jgi:hypothetical protein
VADEPLEVKGEMPSAAALAAASPAPSPSGGASRVGDKWKGAAGGEAKKTEDVPDEKKDEMMANIQRLLAERNVPVEATPAPSSSKPKKFDPIAAKLAQDAASEAELGGSIVPERGPKVKVGGEPPSRLPPAFSMKNKYSGKMAATVEQEAIDERAKQIVALRAEAGKEPPLTVCAECGKDGRKLSRCTKCRTVGYCSSACQKKHWPTHRALCVSVMKHRQTNPKVCDRCGIRAKAKCTACRFAVYCGRECQAKARKIHGPQCLTSRVVDALVSRLGGWTDESRAHERANYMEVVKDLPEQVYLLNEDSHGYVREFVHESWQRWTLKERLMHLEDARNRILMMNVSIPPRGLRLVAELADHSPIHDARVLETRDTDHRLSDYVGELVIHMLAWSPRAYATDDEWPHNWLDRVVMEAKYPEEEEKVRESRCKAFIDRYRDGPSWFGITGLTEHPFRFDLERRIMIALFDYCLVEGKARALLNCFTTAFGMDELCIKDQTQLMTEAELRAHTKSVERRKLAAAKEAAEKKASVY